MSLSKAAEVEFGTKNEERVLARWRKTSKYANGAARVLRTDGYADCDFLLFTQDYYPLVYVEVKVRRKSFAQYGDAIFPWRKHVYAKHLAGYNIPLVGVTEYSCGTLTEVPLGDKPSEKKFIERKDRPGEGSDHAVYNRGQITVLAKGRK